MGWGGWEGDVEWDGDDDPGDKEEDLIAALKISHDSESDDEGEKSWQQQQDDILWKRLSHIPKSRKLWELRNDLFSARSKLLDMTYRLKELAFDNVSDKKITALEEDLVEKSIDFLRVIQTLASSGDPGFDGTMYLFFAEIWPSCKTSKMKMKMLNTIARNTLNSVKIADQFYYPELHLANFNLNTLVGEQSPSLPLPTASAVGNALFTTKPERTYGQVQLCVTGDGAIKLDNAKLAKKNWKLIEKDMKMIGPYGLNKLMIPIGWKPSYDSDGDDCGENDPTDSD